MKLGILTLTILAAGIAGPASASAIKGTPYTFTGSVVSATASCPYAAKARLSGYTLLASSYEYSFKPPNTYTKKPIFSGPALVFSPAGAADKVIMKMSNLPGHSGAASGGADIVALPSADVFKGRYTGMFTVNGDQSFGLEYTMTYKNAGKTCTSKYNLTLKKGLPANLLKLL